MGSRNHEILIVDDNPENLRVLNTVLAQEGYDVRAATDGKQALESIRMAEPDLILLDVHMPEMNGLDVCRTVRNNPRYENLPVIFLSALNDSFNKLQGFEAGGIDYVTKPFDVDEVKARIRTHLDLRRNRLEVDRLKRALERKDAEIVELKAQLSAGG